MMDEEKETQKKEEKTEGTSSQEEIEKEEVEEPEPKKTGETKEKFNPVEIEEKFKKQDGQLKELEETNKILKKQISEMELSGRGFGGVEQEKKETTPEEYADKLRNGEIPLK